MNKDNVQENALTLSKTYDNLLLTFATGVGKSLAALKIAISHLEEHSSEWLILCEETSHIKNWEREFITHKLEKYRKYFKIVTYASSHKVVSPYVILDECHHAISDRRLSILKSYNLKKVIGLSATLSFKKKIKLLSILKGPVKEYHISLKEAINLNLLPTPKLKVIYIDLDNTTLNIQYVKKKGNLKNQIKKECSFKEWKNIYFKTPEIHLTINCTQLEYYRLLNEDIHYLQNNHFKVKKEWSKFIWLNKASKRKNFLGEIKTPVIKELIKKCENYRFICFTNSINQCEAVGTNTIHSKKDNKENEILINKFNSKEINSLFCVRKLREGVNLVDIEKAIITQIDSEDLSFYQMLGRALRGEDPEIYLIIIKNSQDEVYFESIKNDLKNLITYE